MPRDMIESGNEPRPARDVWQAMLRGFSQRCPKCGKGTLFHSYLKVNDACGVCGEELHHQRADDFPAYLVIVIVGHLVVPLILHVEMVYEPAYWSAGCCRWRRPSHRRCGCIRSCGCR